MSDTEELKTIENIKKDKKIKKELPQEVIEVRRKNAEKAREARDKKVNDKNKIKVLERNITSLINNNDSDDDDSDIEIRPKKEKKKEEVIEKRDEVKENEYRLLLDHITNINKKVEKLYIMKKNKPNKVQQQPIIINSKNEKEDLLTAFRNKMLNN